VDAALIAIAIGLSIDLTPQLYSLKYSPYIAPLVIASVASMCGIFIMVARGLVADVFLFIGRELVACCTSTLFAGWRLALSMPSRRGTRLRARHRQRLLPIVGPTPQSRARNATPGGATEGRSACAKGRPVADPAARVAGS